MGKNARRQIEYIDTFHNVALSCDSLEECDVLDWCIEAAQLGIIQDFVYQPPPIKLSDAVTYVAWNNKSRTLLREHIYSPDFCITFDPRKFQTLCKYFKMSFNDSQQESFQVYLDVKGTFQRNDGGRAFSINQKWVYQKTRIYVHKAVPKEFFAECGCPQACFVTRKTGKLRKAFKDYKSIKETFCIQ